MNGISYTTQTFSEVYSSVDLFVEGYISSPFPQLVSSTDIQTIYWLLIGQYANSPMMNSSVDQFKVKLFSLIYQYGPTYCRQMELQKSMRELTEEQMRLGSTNINNNAKNNDGLPSDQANEELTMINNQLVTKWKKSPLEAYSTLYGLLDADITKEFLNRFKWLFKAVVADEEPDIYIS